MSISGTFVIDTTGAVLVSVTELTPGTGASNLGKAEDAAHTSGDVGVMVLGVRNDAGSAFAADGDYVPLSIDSSGALRVTGGSGGTQYTEGDTDASITGTAMLMEGAGDTLVAAQGTAADGLLVNLGGNNDVTVTGDALTALQLIDNLVLAEDAAHASSDPGVQALAVRKATPANLSTTDGDYEPLQVSAGRLWTSAVIDTALPSGTNAIGKLAANSGVDIGDVDVTSVVPGTGATNLGKAEDAAHTSGDVGVMALSVRQNSPSSSLAGTEGDYAPLITTQKGALFVDASANAIDTELPAAATLADGASNFSTPSVGACVQLWNGSTWDRARNVIEGTALSSAARTATTNSSDITTYGARGMLVFLRISSAGTGNLRIFVYGKDPVSGQYVSLNNSAPTITATGTYALSLGNGSNGTGVTGDGSMTQYVGAAFSGTVRVTIAHSDGSSWTYSAGYSFTY